MVRFSAFFVAALSLVLSACGSAQPAAPAVSAPPASVAATAAPVVPAAPAQMAVSDLKAQLDASTGLLLLDVRSPEEFTQDGHVVGATLIPLPELEGRLSELPKDTPIACICRSGNRSQTACELLAQQGYNATNVQGGMRAWAAAGFPIE